MFPGMGGGRGGMQIPPELMAQMAAAQGRGGGGRGRGMQMPPGMRLPPGMQMPPGMMGRGMPMGGGMPIFQPRIDTAAIEKKFGVELKKWRCVYPCYLNINKTKDKGRKVAKEYCVKDPHPQDIIDACKYLALPCVPEIHKRHPRDPFVPSRVRVLIKKADDTLYRKDIPNRRTLLVAIGKIIPNLESRAKRLAQRQQIMEKRKEMIEQKIAAEKEAQQKKNEKSSKQKKIEQKRSNKGKGGRSGGRRGRGRGRRR